MSAPIDPSRYREAIAAAEAALQVLRAPEQLSLFGGGPAHALPAVPRPRGARISAAARAIRAARADRTAAQLPLTWRDPARPCVGCPTRRTCAALCPDAERALERAHRRAGSLPLVTDRERLSPALMEGRMPARALPPEMVTSDAGRWPELVERWGPVLAEAVSGSGADLGADLTTQQRRVLGLLLAGRSQSDVARELEVTRQAVSQAKTEGLRRLRAAMEVRCG